MRVKKMQSKSPSLYKLIVLMMASFSSIKALCTASSQNLQTRVCKTAECIEAAQLILKNMDGSIHPCENFYKFACGGFIKETVIPQDKPTVSLFTQEKDVLQETLKQSIEGDLENDDPETFKLLQSYYNVCLDDEKIEKRSMAEIKDILIKLGNWPVLIGKAWNEQNFDWKKIIYKLRQVGYTASVSSIIKFKMTIDEKNTTRYIIVLDHAATAIKREYLSKGVEHEVVQAYYKYMVELAHVLGADYKQAEKELAESLNFEIGLANILESESRNKSQSYNLRTVKQLQYEYPYIPWKEYLSKLLSSPSRIALSEQVVVKSPNFLKSLPQLLSKTPKRVLANYIFWRIVEESAFYLDEQVRSATAKFRAALTGTNAQKPRWVQCISDVSAHLPVATGALHVRKNFVKKTKSDAQVLVRDLRESFRVMLEKVDWMDDETKKSALSKIDAMQTHVAFPDEFFDNEKLDKYFETLKVGTDSFLKNHLNLNLFNFGRLLERFKKPVGTMTWIVHGGVAMVNAYYSIEENLILIPAGILQGNFFNGARPNYMNYGSIGWVAGHEFTHGFDNQGSQYDDHGNLANWWNVATQKEYSKRAQCLIDQYGNYTVEQVGLKLDGASTQGENIADNGGLKEAYLAYENYEKRNGKEARLPGLAYSPKQMFWISAANLWCMKFRPKALSNRILTNVHAPGEFRVIGPFSNMPQFARDFNCPLGSPMNPAKKCIVW